MPAAARIPTSLGAAILAGAAALVSAPGAAQEAGTSRLVLSTGLSHNGDEARAFANADLLLQRQTRSQTLSFQTRAGVAITEAGGAVLDRPRVTLRYAFDSGPVQLDAVYGFERNDVDGFVFALSNDTPGTIDFVEDDGTRTDQFARVSLTVGQRRPVGATVTLRYEETEFDDTEDPTLTETTTRGVDVALRLDVSRVTQVTLGAGASRETRVALEQTEVDRRYLSLGVATEASRVLKLSGALRWNEIEATTDTRTSQSDGLGFSLGASLERPRGTIGLTYDRQVDAGGSIDSLQLTHSLSLSRTQTLSYALGASRYDTGDVTAIGRISYARDLRNGAIRLSASQSAGFDENDDRVNSSRLGASYATDLTRLSSISTRFDVAAVDYLDNRIPDQRTAEIGVTYSHQIARDWDAVADLTYRVAQNGNSDRTVTGLSVSLSRNLSLFR